MAIASAPLYQEVAERISHLIEGGVLQPGQKIPSIRNLALQLGVGMGTVKEAYWLLERRRLIEAQPQSGFYVRPNLPANANPLQEARDPRTLDPQEVSLCRIYGALGNQRSINQELGLSMAEADPALLPVERLSRTMQELLRENTSHLFGYLMTPGSPELRRQIALLSTGHGLAASADDFIITNGCQEAIHIALNAVCQPGDLVAVESPLYFNLITMLEHLHLRILEIPVDAQGMDPGVLAFALEHHAIKAVLCVPNFSNPTGRLMSMERKQELVGLLADREIPLIEDDVYGDLHFSADRPRSCASWDSQENVIYCSSISKTLAPGFRIGWVRGGKWQSAIDRVKTSMNIGTSSLSQVCLARYLAEGGYDRHLRTLRNRLAEQVKLMRAAVIQHFPPLTTVSDPPGGLVVWVGLPGGVDSLDLYQRAMARGIMIAPGSLFSMTGRYRNHIRLNAGIWNPRIEEAVATVGGLCAAKT